MGLSYGSRAIPSTLRELRINLGVKKIVTESILFLDTLN